MSQFHSDLVKHHIRNSFRLPFDEEETKGKSLPPPNFNPTSELSGEQKGQKLTKDVKTAYSGTKSILALRGLAKSLFSADFLKNTKLADKIPGINIATAAYDIFLDDKNNAVDKTFAGMRGFSGITAALVAAGHLPEVALGAKLSGSGALASGGGLASGGAALTSLGAVLGAGAAGYGLGRGMDNLGGFILNQTGFSEYADKKLGIKRKEGENADYNMSDIMGENLHTIDKAFADKDEQGNLDYTSTLGWKLAELMP